MYCCFFCLTKVILQFSLQRLPESLGSVAIFTLASEKEHSRSSRIVAAGLWIVACMIRHDCAKMVLGAWCVVLFAEFVLLVWRKENLLETVSKKMEMAALCCVYLCVGAQTFKSRNVCRRKRLLEFILEE